MVVVPHKKVFFFPKIYLNKNYKFKGFWVFRVFRYKRTYLMRSLNPILFGLNQNQFISVRRYKSDELDFSTTVYI